MRSWIPIVLALTACRSGSKPAEQTATKSADAAAVGSAGSPGSAAGATGSAAGSAGSAADPWADKAKPGPTPEERKQQIAAALARVPGIQTKLAALRGLPMAGAVPALHQTADEFRTFVQQELAKELPPDKAEKMQAALLHIGLYMKPIDLVKTLEQTMTSQAAAYYDPAAKKFFVVMAPDNDMMFDTISAHELTHALQDKHFDLVKYMPITLDEDAGIARRFVVEGDATFSMFAYLATDAVGVDKLPSMIKMMRTQVEQMANMGLSDYADMMKQQAAAFGGMDEQMKTAMESMGELPPVIVGPMMASYMKGAVLAMTAYENGGWKTVDALYKTPPDSTEQVLHPATKLYPKRERPKKVTLPKLAGTELTQNVIGELQWSIYLQQWGAALPEAAAGWGGDRYAVMRGADGALTGYLATTWDSPKDAQEFHDAYVATLKARFPEADVSKPAAGVARKDRGKVFVKLQGAHVFIVDGTDDAKALDLLARATIK
ncbi:MAG: hypothetical protein H0T42_14010 [Deltaproteobacteria bacterium]|nr:hypothetical protein [Deltaproteobacteria bacterium]